jgi:hypothetical protein
VKKTLYFLLKNPQFFYVRWKADKEYLHFLLWLYAKCFQDYGINTLFSFFRRYLENWERHKLYLIKEGRGDEWEDRRKKRFNRYEGNEERNFDAEGTIVVRAKRGNAFFTFLDTRTSKVLFSITAGTSTRRENIRVKFSRSIKRKMKMERTNLEKMVKYFLQKVSESNKGIINIDFKSNSFWYRRFILKGLKSRGMLIGDLRYNLAIPHHLGKRGCKIRRV